MLMSNQKLHLAGPRRAGHHLQTLLLRASPRTPSGGHIWPIRETPGADRPHTALHRPSQQPGCHAGQWVRGLPVSVPTRRTGAPTERAPDSGAVTKANSKQLPSAGSLKKAQDADSSGSVQETHFSGKNTPSWKLKEVTHKNPSQK